MGDKAENNAGHKGRGQRQKKKDKAEESIRTRRSRVTVTHLVAAQVHVEVVGVAPLQVRQHRHLARCQVIRCQVVRRDGQVRPGLRWCQVIRKDGQVRPGVR